MDGYIEPYVYEGDCFCLKHDDDNNIIIEFYDKEYKPCKEYPVYNMDMSFIEEERENEDNGCGGWSINFLPTAKVHTKWKYITFSDNSSGFDITDEDTGETKFYTEIYQGGFEVESDDGDVLYLAGVISISGNFDGAFIVGFVRKEDLDPYSSYYPGNC